MVAHVSSVQTHVKLDTALSAEDLLAAVAHATGTCIGIAADRLETIVTAGLPAQLFTTEMGFTRIRWVQLYLSAVDDCTRQCRVVSSEPITPY